VTGDGLATPRDLSQESSTLRNPNVQVIIEQRFVARSEAEQVDRVDTIASLGQSIQICSPMEG
jgi:hypothetical protein